MPTKVVTGKVRFSYANVFEPWSADPTQEKKYGVALLIPKNDTATLNKIKAAVEAAKQAGAQNQWGGKIPPNLKTPLRDGDAERPDDPAYQGHFFVNANSKNPPGIVDAGLNPIIDRREFYSGCYGRASVNFYPYNVSGNRGVACGLNNLQKLHEGEPLSGSTRPEDDFAEEFTEADDFLN